MAGTERMNSRRRALAFALLGTLAVVAVAGPAPAADEAAGRIERIDLKAEGSSTKVFVMLSRPLAFDVHVLDGDAAKKSARRLILDFANATLAPEAAKPIEVGNDFVQKIRPGQFNAKTARIVLDLGDDATHSVEAFESPPHVTISLGGKTTVSNPPITGTATAGTPSTAEAAAVAAPATNPSESVKTAPKAIPIRARGRRPYSLMYAR